MSISVLVHRVFLCILVYFLHWLVSESPLWFLLGTKFQSARIFSQGSCGSHNSHEDKAASMSVSVSMWKGVCICVLG